MIEIALTWRRVATLGRIDSEQRSIEIHDAGTGVLLKRRRVNARARDIDMGRHADPQARGLSIEGSRATWAVNRAGHGVVRELVLPKE